MALDAMVDSNDKDKLAKELLDCRRKFILQSGAGFATLPLASMLGRDGFFNSGVNASESMIASKTSKKTTLLKKSKALCFSFHEWRAQPG